MLNNNIYLESGCFNEAQATPTKEEVVKKSYKEHLVATKKLVEDYISNNNRLVYCNLIIPKFNTFEINERKKIRELSNKGQAIHHFDKLLLSATELSQNINHMLGNKDTIENYSFVMKLSNKLEEIGVLMINLSEYAVILNPQDDYYKQRDTLYKVYKVVNLIQEKGLTPGYMDSEECSLFHKVIPTILFSVENLGYDITEEEYDKLYFTKERINNESIVLAAKELGFNINFLFKTSKVKIENNNKIIDDIF